MTCELFEMTKKVEVSNVHNKCECTMVVRYNDDEIESLDCCLIMPDNNKYVGGETYYTEIFISWKDQEIDGYSFEKYPLEFGDNLEQQINNIIFHSDDWTSCTMTRETNGVSFNRFNGGDLKERLDDIIKSCVEEINCSKILIKCASKTS